MPFLAKSALFIFFMATLSLLFLLQLQPTACIEAASHEVYGRKLLMSGGKMAVKKEIGAQAGQKRFNGAWDQLREAPLGPDPLHHHGSSPKKPKTP